MSIETVELILAKIEELGVAVSETVVEGFGLLYPIAYRKVVTESLLDIGAGIAWILIALLLFKIATRLLKDDEHFELGGIIGLFLGIIAFLMVLFALFDIRDALPRLSTPDYYTIEAIKKMVGI